MSKFSFKSVFSNPMVPVASSFGGTGGAGVAQKYNGGSSNFKDWNSAWDILNKPFGLDIGAPEGAPATPTMADASAAGAAERRRTASGRASTILTGPQGEQSEATLASRALFGSTAANEDEMARQRRLTTGYV